MLKKLKWGLLATALVVMLFVSVLVLNYYSEHKNIVSEVDRHLSQDDTKVYTDRLATIDTALSTTTDDAQKFNLYMQKGFNLYGLGKLAEANQWYSKASKLKPDDSGPYVSLFESKAEMNDKKGAEEAIKKAILLKSSEPDFWKKYITLEKEKFQASNDQIKSLYAEALDKTAGSIRQVDIITVYAEFLESIQDYKTAQEYWHKAKELNPAQAQVYKDEIDRIQKIIDIQA